MAEIVSIEHNGEIFDVEVPDGTPDDQVLEFVKQQGGAAAQPADELDVAKQALRAKQEEAMAPFVGGAQAAFDLGKQVVSNPIVQKGLEVGGELYAGKKLIVDPALKRLEAMRGGTPGPVAPQSIPNTPEQTFRTLQTPEPALNAQSASNAARGVTPQVAPAAPAAPVQPPPTAPTAQAAKAAGTMTPQAQQYMQQAAQSAAPAAESSIMSKAGDIVRKLALDKVLKGAGVVGAALPVAAGMFYTSPEEIAVLKAAEAKKRAQGWKPINER